MATARRDSARGRHTRDNGRVMSQYVRFREIHELFACGQIEEGRRALLELQARYIVLCDELDVMKKQIKEFEDIIFLSENLVAEKDGYWLRTGKLRQGPFCKPCYDHGGKLIRLELHQSVWRCPHCGLLFRREAELAAVAGSAFSPLPAFADGARPERRGAVIPFRAPAQPR